MFECSLLLVDLLEHRPIFSPGYSAVSGSAFPKSSRMLMPSRRGDVTTLPSLPSYTHSNSARVLLWQVAHLHTTEEECTVVELVSQCQVVRH